MLTETKKRLKKRGGSLFMLMAFWVATVMVPLMAVAFDLGQIYLYKLYLSHVAQMSALSVMPHASNIFSDTKVSTPKKIAEHAYKQNIGVMTGNITNVQSMQQTDMSTGKNHIPVDTNLITKDLLDANHFRIPPIEKAIKVQPNNSKTKITVTVVGYYKPVFLCNVMRGVCANKEIRIESDPISVTGMFVD